MANSLNTKLMTVIKPHLPMPELVRNEKVTTPADDNELVSAAMSSLIRQRAKDERTELPMLTSMTSASQPPTR